MEGGYRTTKRDQTDLQRAISFLHKNILDQYRNVRQKKALKLAYLCEELRTTSKLSQFEIKIREITALLTTMMYQLSFYPDTCIIVRGLLAECFLKQMSSNDIVTRILRCLKDKKDIESYIQRMIAFPDVILPSEVLEERQRNGLRSFCFASYVLHHANEGRIILNGQRFIVQTGLSPGADSDDVSKLCIRELDETRNVTYPFLILLQYGVRFSGRKRISHSNVPDIIKNTLLIIIKSGVNEKLWKKNSLIIREEPLIMSNKVRDMCDIFKALLKDTMNPHETTFHLAERYGFNYCTPDLELLIPFYDTVFPKCEYGRQITASLRHMSRYVIRKTLYKNWKLPDGIQCLPIPPVLKDYLNLLLND